MLTETMISYRADDTVTVEFHGCDEGRKEAARTVRAYCRTWIGGKSRVTHRASFVRRIESNGTVAYSYTLIGK